MLENLRRVTIYVYEILKILNEKIFKNWNFISGLRYTRKFLGRKFSIKCVFKLIKVSLRWVIIQWTHSSSVIIQWTHSSSVIIRWTHTPPQRQKTEDLKTFKWYYLPTTGSNNSDDFWVERTSVPHVSKKWSTSEAFETAGGKRIIF